MAGRLIQLIAYGYQNPNYMPHNLLYSLDLLEIKMEPIFKPNLDVHTSEYKYEYECQIFKISDQFKIQGIIIELDDRVDECSKTILDILNKLTLELYNYDTKENKMNFIGSIPLILGSITNDENTIIIKLPNIFFLSKSKYFNGFINYCCKINTPTKFKKIILINVIRLDSNPYRKNICYLSKIFMELDYQYAASYNLSNPKITENNEYVCNLIYEKNFIGYQKVKFRELYLAIPDELIEFINKIKFNFNLEKIIGNDELENIYKIEDKGFVNLYLIKFDYVIDLEPINSIVFEFKFEPKLELEFDNCEDLRCKINKLFNDIYIYPMVLNKLISIDCNLRLKYIDGKINSEFDEQEKILINKYSDNLDLLIDKIIPSNNETELKKDINNLNLKKIILEYIK